MKVFESFLRSNKAFWSQGADTNGKKRVALIDASVNDTYLLHGVVKVGLTFSRLHGLRPLIFTSVRVWGRDRAMVKSMCAESVPVVWYFLVQLVAHAFSAMRMLASVKAPADTLKLQVGGVPVGKYIYDQCYAPLVDTLTLRMRLRILYALVSFYVDEAVIRRNHAQLVIIGDPVSRGFLFELCKANGIKCISAINIHSFQMHKYFRQEEFENHCRYVTAEMLHRIPENDVFRERLEEYFERRFKGMINAHDVIRAYGLDKTVYSKEQLCAEYGLQSGKPLVVVMAHCFNDTPHAFPGMLYRDYEEWLVRTVLALSKNLDVNFLIKEHPSSDVYNEQGMLLKLLESTGCSRHVLKRDVHTRSVIDAADAAVTCGGTIGLEMSSYGKPVVLAAQPPYAKKGFTVECESREAYERLLATAVQRVDPLTKEQSTAARKTAFIMLELYDNFSRSLELGGITYVKGERYCLDEFFRNVISENGTPLENQEIYRRLDAFNKSDDVSIINYQKLRALESSGSSLVGT